MSSVEERLAKLEKMLGYGLFGTEGDTAAVIDQMERQTRSLAALQHEKNVGNVLGGMIRTEIAPGLVSIGPYRQDLDSTYPVEFDLWVSDKILRVREAIMRIVPKPARTSSAVAASSGILTSNDGGGTTTHTTGTLINVESAGHVHIWLGKNGAAAMTGSAVHSGANVGAPSAALNAAASPHTHVETGGVTNGDTLPISLATGTHTHTPATTQVPTVSLFTNYMSYDATGSSDATRRFDMVPVSGTPTDYYTAISPNTPTSVPTADHQHAVDDHHHTIPGHSHTLTLSIAESGMAAGLHLYIDGVDRTTALGGPWDAEVALDVTQYLVNVRNEPVLGAHRIKVTSTAVGAVEVTGDLYAVIRAIT